jgi:hypothetical protein
METYRLHHPKSPELHWGDPNQGLATRKMEFKIPNKHSVSISAWEWDAVGCKWSPCFKNKSVYLATQDPLWFHHMIAVPKEKAREIWTAMRKEGWIR